MTRVPLTALAFAALPTGVFACPVGDDALNGIEVIYSATERSVITRGVDGSVTEVEYAQDATYTYVAANGILETAYWENDGQGYRQFSYTFDLPTATSFVPWSGSRGIQISTDENGGDVERVPFAWSSQGSSMEDIAGCAYKVTPFQLTYFNSDAITVAGFWWVEALQISLLISYASGVETPSLYTPLEIRKLVQ